MNLPSLSRRGLLRAAGARVAVSATTLAGARAPVLASAGSGRSAQGLLIPPGKIGIQQWSIRNAVAGLGFRVVFAELSRVGYRYFEFFDYTSPAAVRTDACPVLKR